MGPGLIALPPEAPATPSRFTLSSRLRLWTVTLTSVWLSQSLPLCLPLIPPVTSFRIDRAGLEARKLSYDGLLKSKPAEVSTAEAPGPVGELGGVEGRRGSGLGARFGVMEVLNKTPPLP